MLIVVAKKKNESVFFLIVRATVGLLLCDHSTVSGLSIVDD